MAVVSSVLEPEGNLIHCFWNLVITNFTTGMMSIFFNLSNVCIVNCSNISWASSIGSFSELMYSLYQELMKSLTMYCMHTLASFSGALKKSSQNLESVNELLRAAVARTDLCFVTVVVLFVMNLLMMSSTESIMSKSLNIYFSGI